MFRGVRALFSSKIVLDPFFWMGAFFALYLNAKLENEDIIFMFKKYQLYVLVFILSVCYNVFLKKSYKLGGYTVDWEETTVKIIGSFARFFITAILSLCLIKFLLF